MSQSIRIVAAMSSNRVIGNKNSIPWRLPEDQTRLRRMTTGHVLIMGRRTYESIGHALPDRVNIVVSRDPSYALVDATVVHSLEEAYRVCGEYPNRDVFVFGGGEIYRAALDRVDTIDLTLVHGEYEGDTFFPPFEEDFVEVAREE